MADPVPYLARGGEKLTTESTTLISSSDYLNEPRLRDWLATAFLRKSGKDSPTTHDAYKLYGILVDVFDIDRIEALFTAERKRWPELDAWFAEGFSSSFSTADLLAYPEGSFGHRFGRYIHDNGFEIDIVPRFVPKNQFQYFSLRSGQDTRSRTYPDRRRVRHPGRTGPVFYAAEQSAALFGPRARRADQRRASARRAAPDFAHRAALPRRVSVGAGGDALRHDRGRSIGAVLDAQIRGCVSPAAGRSARGAGYRRGGRSGYPRGLDAMARIRVTRAARSVSMP